jgi:hypothetical protein
MNSGTITAISTAAVAIIAAITALIQVIRTKQGVNTNSQKIDDLHRVIQNGGTATVKETDKTP